MEFVELCPNDAVCVNAKSLFHFCKQTPGFYARIVSKNAKLVMMPTLTSFAF